MQYDDIRSLFLSFYNDPIFILVIYKLAIIVAIIVGIYIAVNFVKKLIQRFVKKYYRAAHVGSLLKTVTTVVFWILGIVMILQTLGIAVTPILTALGIGGLALALGIQDTFANLFAGIHLLISGQIKVGDHVELDSGHKGKIMDILWRYTVLEVNERERVIIPNAKMAQSIIRRFSQ